MNKVDFLDHPEYIEEAQYVNQIASDYSRSTSGPASWTNPRTGATYSVASGGTLALAKAIRDARANVLGVLDALNELEADKQEISSGATLPSNPKTGQEFFYTALSPAKPVWYNGTNWVNSAGADI